MNSFEVADKKYVPGHGPLGAKLFILGEAPSYVETSLGLPFQGPAGQELNRILHDADINRNNC